LKRFLTGAMLVSIMLFTIVFSTGCWNRRELDTLAILSGLGIDTEKIEGRDVIKLTAQIVKPGEVRAPSTDEKGGGGSSPVLVLESTGDTVFDAVRNFTMKSSRKILFPHNQVIIVGEEAARAGMQPLLDLFVRDHESRSRVWILVARGKAGDILRAKVGQEKIPAMGIADLEEASFATSKTSAMRLQEFINCLLSKTTAPVVSAINLHKEEKETAVKLEGSAFFKDGKLAGYLDGTETRGLLWVVGKVKSGVIALDCPGSDKKVSLEIIRASSKVKTKLRNGKVFIEVAIKEEGNLADQMCLEELTTPEKLALLEKRQGEMIKREMEAALKKARQYKADIFGFGEVVYRSHPTEWKNMEHNWEEIFPEIEVKITVMAKLRRVGMTTKPLKPE